jgi:Arm DNA-binding domain
VYRQPDKLLVFLLVSTRRRQRGTNIMALTDIAIRASKPRVKSFKLTDNAGLHLLITPRGGKFWRFSYRFAGKQKTLALGAYPIVTLAEARDGRDIARKHLAAGVDPSIKRKIDKQSAANTFSGGCGRIAEKVRARRASTHHPSETTMVA